MSNKKHFMAGTEGTGSYIVLAQTSRGRIGIRVLSGARTIRDLKEARIRVEPAESPQTIAKMASLLSPGTWKQPGDDGQHRFSAVAGPSNVRKHVRSGLEALGVGTLKTEVNASAPKWARDLAQTL